MLHSDLCLSNELVVSDSPSPFTLNSEVDGMMRLVMKKKEKVPQEVCQDQREQQRR